MKLSTIDDGIWTIENFMSTEECDSWIKYCEEKGFEKAKIGVGRVQKLNLSIRNNDRYIHDDAKLAKDLYARVKDFAPQELSISTISDLNNRFRFYKYLPGQRFKMHQDGSYIKNINEWSEFTFMVYLNEGMSGGETTFINCSIKPTKGTALIFKHQLMHEGAEIKDGVKYVLRSDIMYKRKQPNQPTQHPN